jgi:hypothetical protein
VLDLICQRAEQKDENKQLFKIKHILNDIKDLLHNNLIKWQQHLYQH